MQELSVAPLIGPRIDQKTVRTMAVYVNAIHVRVAVTHVQAYAPNRQPAVIMTEQIRN